MKYRYAVVIVLCLALLGTACHRTTPPVAGTPNPTVPQATTDTPGPLHPTAEPKDDNSAPTDQDPEIPLWYNQDPQYLSYEDFLSSDRILHAFSSSPYWYVRHGDTFVQARFDPYCESDSLVIKSGETEYQVPGSEKLTGYTPIGSGSDGHYVYMNSSTDIIRVDLLTGETETVFNCDQLFQVLCYDKLVLMILAENAGIRNIYRIYLPTLDTDVFYEGIPADTPLYCFELSGSYSASGPFTWNMMNPTMTDVLRKELTSPDSIYRVNSFTGSESDYSSIWDTVTLNTTNKYEAPPPSLLHEIQSHTGIHAWVKCAYNPADGSYQETTGIIDRCWYGSGYSHDHYDPKEYDVLPAWNVSEAISISNISLPEDPEKMYDEDLNAFMDTNYAYIDGFICHKTKEDAFRILFDMELTEVKFAPDYLYGITPDNTLVQVSYDGTVSNTIYTADSGILSKLIYGSGKLYFLENETTLMEVDIPAKTFRSLLKIPYCSIMYLDEPNVLFFESAKGLSVSMYIADFSNLTLEKTHRL